MSDHMELILNAKTAIERIYSDTVVTKEETIDSLSEIMEDITQRIETLQEEIKNDNTG